MFARLLTPDGTPSGPAVRVDDARAGDQRDPEVVALETGGFAVVWTGATGTGATGVFAREFDAAGARLDGATRVDAAADGPQGRPAAAPLPGGGFAVAWDGPVRLQLFGTERPALSDLAAETAEDAVLVLDAALFEAGFADLGGDPLAEATVTRTPDRGALRRDGVEIGAGETFTRAELAAGALSYLGDPDAFGPDSFRWTAADAAAGAGVDVRLDLAVTPVNDPPALEAGPDATAAEGAVFSRVLSLGDPDADTRTITVDYGDGADEILVTADAAPGIAHVYADDGVYAVTVRVDDGSGAADAVETDGFAVTVANRPPEARDDAVAVAEDGPAVAGDVFADNGAGADSDPGADGLTVTALQGGDAELGAPVTLASGARVVLTADGTFAYDPAGAFEALAEGAAGTDRFAYAISDGDGGTDSAAVTVTVRGANDAPTAAPDRVAVPVAGIATIEPLANDSDVDAGDAVSLARVDGRAAVVGTPITLASGATVTPRSASALLYDPAGPGTEGFTYAVADRAGAVATGTVTVETVGVDAPPVAADDALSLSEDGGARRFDVRLDNGAGPDRDPEGGALRVAAVQGDAAGVGAALTLGAGLSARLAASGALTLDPAGAYEALSAGAVARERFTYRVADPAGLEAEATVTVSILGENDAPEARDDALSLAEGGAGAADLLADNGAGADADPDAGDALVVRRLVHAASGASVAAGGTLSLAGGAEASVRADGGFAFAANGAYDALGTGETATERFDYVVADRTAGGLTDAAAVTVTVTGVNDAPRPADDAVAVDADATRAGDLLADNGFGPDLDPEGAALTVTALEGVPLVPGAPIRLGSGARLTVSADGAFDYDPDGRFEALAAGETATDAFVYAAADPEGLAAPATVTVTVRGANDAPAAADDALSLGEDGAATANLLAANGGAADADPDGEAPVVVSVNGVDAAVGAALVLGAGLRVTVGADGTARLDAAGAYEALGAGEAATERFVYAVADPAGLRDSATVTVTVRGANDDPVAADDRFEAAAREVVSGSVLVANGPAGAPDSDVDAGATLSVVAVDGVEAAVGETVATAAGGRLRLRADGAFEYDQNGAFAALGAGETAEDGFAYTLADGAGGRDTARVTLRISGVNRPPVAVDDAGLTVSEDGPALAGDVLADNGAGPDADPNGDRLTVVALDGDPARVGAATVLASGAVVTLSADGTFDYDPAGAFDDLRPGEVRADGFDYAVADPSGASDEASVAVTVTGAEDAPDPGPAVVAVANEDAADLGLDLLAGARDADAGQDLDVAAGATVAASVAGVPRAVAAALDPEIGRLSLAAGQFADLDDGRDATVTVDYAVTDGALAVAAATATLTVLGANDAPVAPDAGFDAPEDGPVTVALVPADADPDAGDAPRLLRIAGRTPAVGESATTARGAVVTRLDDLRVRYDPAGRFEALTAGETATDAFAFSVTDGDAVVPAVAVATVRGADDAPVPGPAIAVEAGEDAGDVALALLAGATDADAGAALAVVGLSVSAEAGGTPRAATVALDPETGVALLRGGGFEDLDDGRDATVTLDFRVSDGVFAVPGAPATVTVRGANDAPVAADDAAETGEDAALRLDPLANDSDPDAGDALSVVRLDGAAAAVGATVRLRSGALAVLEADGRVRFDPDGRFEALAEGATAETTLRYAVSDGDAEDAATARITILGADDPPEAADDAATVAETGTVAIDPTANDTDPDAGEVPALLSFAGVAATPGARSVLPSGAVVALRADGRLSYDPAGAFDALPAGAAAGESFVYVAGDARASDAAEVRVTVTGENTAPVAEDDGVAVAADGAVAIAPLENDSDADAGARLSVLLFEGSPPPGPGETLLLSTGGAIRGTADGGYVFDAAGDFAALDTGETTRLAIDYTVEDGDGLAASATLRVTVRGVNDAPTTAPVSAELAEDAADAPVDLLAGAADADGEALSVVGLSAPALPWSGAPAAAALDAEGRLRLEAGQFDRLAAGEDVTLVFDYAVSDGDAATPGSAELRIVGADDAPVLAPDAAATDEDATVALDPLANDADPDAADALSLVSVAGAGLAAPGDSATLASGARVTLRGDGRLDYDPRAALEALDLGDRFVERIAYAATDGTTTVTAEIAVEVAGRNDPPAAADDAGAGFAANEDAAFRTAPLLANDADPDAGAALAIAAIDGAPLGPGETARLASGATVRIDGEAVIYDPAGAFEALAEGAAARDSFVYAVSDGLGGADAATVTVDVAGRNDAPVAVDDSGPGFATRADRVFVTGALLDNDLDVDDGAALLVVAVDGTPLGPADVVPLASGARVQVNDGALVYDPAGAFDALPAGESAVDVFTYAVADEFGARDEASVTVEVSGVAAADPAPGEVGAGPVEAGDDPFG